MSFKAFEPEEIIPFLNSDVVNISVSTGSTSAQNINFFTGVRSLGKINFFDSTQPASFGLSQSREKKYVWNYDKSTIPSSSITAERTTGIFLSSKDQTFQTGGSLSSSQLSHQSIFNYTQGYLYRNNNSYTASATGLRSTSTAIDISVHRLITLHKSLVRSFIQPTSFRMEMNLGTTSITGIVTNTSATGLTTALDLKNPYSGKVGHSFHSFFGVPWISGSSLDTSGTGMTIEVIFRPYNQNSVLLWRRLSSDNYEGANTKTQNSFLKLELVKSPNNLSTAFRFYIRSTTSDTDFTTSFAKQDVQASGLFVPSDVGINLYDGNFHHVIVSWGVSGVDGSTTTESGAGAVFGYIDGFKLKNREITIPRLGGADESHGPTVQANMFEQRIPIRTIPISFGDVFDASPSGNNLYVGTSNFRREKDDVIGDRGILSLSSDTNLNGSFDGQIQHLRMWNKRFTDGTTGLDDSINDILKIQTSSAWLSFNNFKDNLLTATTASLIAWWEFNEINAASAADSSSYSNTGSVVGQGKINLYDYADITVTANKGAQTSINDATISSISRTFLYFDTPEKGILQNNYEKGRIIRKAADGSLIRVGTIFYDHGIVVLDGNDENAKLNFLWPSSGTTGDFGFTVTGNNNSAFNVERISINSIDKRGALILESVAEGSEFNYSNNNTSITQETGQSIFNEPQTFITSIGLYNANGDLHATGKFSKPIKKDEATKLITQIKLNF